MLRPGAVLAGLVDLLRSGKLIVGPKSAGGDLASRS
jgi:hypothetical protein